MTHRLEIVELTCTRGDRPLFEGLSHRLNAGELLHVAGSNGSGKTTLLRTLSGLSRPALGDIRWGGASIRTLGDEYRQDLSYVGHQDGIQGELTLLENLKVYYCMAPHPHTSSSRPASAGMKRPAPVGQESFEDILERLGLAPYRSFPAKILSQGQKRRLALARLLVTQKPLWLLDEPFTALDVRSCRLMTGLLTEHLAAGGMAVISSHQDFEMPQTMRQRIELDGSRPDVPSLAAATNPAGQAAVGRTTA